MKMPPANSSVEARAELREALYEGAALELIPTDSGWIGRVGVLDVCVVGRTAAEVLLNAADILMDPLKTGQQ